MRVAFLTHYAELYGANRSMLALIDGLSEYDISAAVIAPREGPISAELRDRGIPFHTSPIGRCATAKPAKFREWGIVRRAVWRIRAAGKHIGENLKALPSILGFLRTWGSDVVYSNSSLILSGALAAMRLGRPHVWHLREFGERDYLFIPIFGHRVHRRLINSAEGVIAVSDALRDFYRVGNGSNIHVVYSGVGWKSEFLRQREEIEAYKKTPHTAYTFILVGLLHPAKGQETAIRAMSRVLETRRDVKLVLMGSGRPPYPEKLCRLVEELGLQDVVEFRGYASDVFAAFRDADAALMCSENEAMGRVTVEAMAACRPVIGYRSAGTEELVEHEKTGLLYSGDSGALAECMLRFVDNPMWARELGQEGWYRASQDFTIEQAAAKVYRVLNEVTNSKFVQQG